MLISILTGFAAGALHVVGGADHVVSMAPSSIRKPRLAIRDGLAWGFGHSTGVLILSLIAVLARDLVNIQQMSSWAEFFVGLTLLGIGAFAIRKALGVNIHMHKHKHESGENHRHMHFHFLGRKLHAKHSHAATGLGVIHGLAGGSHLLAVIPALALPPIGVLFYMVSFFIGSIMAMGFVVLGISFAAGRAGAKYSKIMMGVAGGLSIATGFFWLQKTSSNFLL